MVCTDGGALMALGFSSKQKRSHILVVIHDGVADRMINKQ